MKTGIKWLPALMFGLYVSQAESKELLGGISDETAPPVAQPEQPAADQQGKIIYRVICSPEGELLPECAQPPVSDTFEAAQPRRAEPKSAETPAIIEAPNEQSEQTDRGDQPVNATEPVTPKKATKHKKRSKKSARKHTKKTDKPVNKRKRR